jgi:ABC-type dipeptide/oligopeptide/nickel transport system ATPase component
VSSNAESVNDPDPGPEPPLLDVRDLRVRFRMLDGTIFAVNGISLHLDRGETLGLVGESGSGKSVTSLALMRLLPPEPAAEIGGEIEFDGRDISNFSEKQMRPMRGRDIAMVFQDPMTSLNPVLRIGEQVEETIKAHREIDTAGARARATELLRLVGIADPERQLERYPHEFSGGMRQRVMIAMALALEPKLLIADEPTTALDVTIQAQVLELLQKLTLETGTALILITHDLGVVARMTRRVAVMYAGLVVESASTGELFADPRHLHRRVAAFHLLARRRGAPRHRGLAAGFRRGLRIPSPRCAWRPTRAGRRCPGSTPGPASDDGAEHVVACHYPVTPRRRSGPLTRLRGGFRRQGRRDLGPPLELRDVRVMQTSRRGCSYGG